MKVFLKYLGAVASVICYAIVFFGIILILEVIGYQHYDAEIIAQYEASEAVNPKIAENVTLDNFKKIKIDASYADICKLLGGEGNISLSDLNDSGDPAMRSGDYVWMGVNKETKIFVLFDKDNKVAYKRFYPMPDNETIPGKPFKFEKMKNLKGMSYANLCKTAGSPGSIFLEGRGDIYRLKDRKTHLSKNQTVSLYIFNALYEPEEKSDDLGGAEDSAEQKPAEKAEDEVGVFRAVFVDGVYRDDVIPIPVDEDIIATSSLL